MKLETRNIKSPFGVTLAQPLFRADSAQGLMILLPGRGYTVHHPALAYMAYMGVEQGFDVLGVQYGFQMLADVDFNLGQISQLRQDIDRTLATVDLDSYRHVVIVGKSLGTPLAMELGRDIACGALILLTPIPLALGGDPPAPTLALIGTADPVYSPQLVTDHPALRWKVYPDLDHGFVKAGDWRTSLDALGQIVQDCADFLKETLS